MDSLREYLIIIGWVISLLISFHAFKRSEVYRAKDKLIDKIDKLHEWLVKEMKSIKEDEDKVKMLQIVESFTSSKLSQIEISATQYNRFIQYDVIEIKLIFEIRSIDFVDGDVKNTINILNNSINNLSESIEENFSKYSNESIFRRLSDRY